MDGERSSRRLRRIQRSYDRSAARYDAFMEHGLSGRLFGRGRKGVGEFVRGRVLEVGIGSGLMIPHYRPGLEVVGVDLSLGMLRHAARRRPAPGLTTALLEMDAQRLAFRDACFDSVAFTLCLCTVPDPLAAIREGLRVARPGALMVFLEHVRSDVWPVALIQDLISPLTVLIGEDSFNRDTEGLVRAAGVEVQTVERWALGAVTLIRGTKPAD